MNRLAARQPLRLDGLIAVAAMLVLPIVGGLVEVDLASGSEAQGMALFAIGLLLLFPSLPGFRRYKHALIATEQAFDTDRELAAWARLRRVRRQGLLLAALPALAAAVGGVLGTESAARVMLTLGSLMLAWLYRVPRQLR